MDNTINRIMGFLPRPSDALLLPALALKKVTSKHGNGVYASDDDLYKGAIFGRDSLEVAEDLITTRPDLARAVLLTMVALQGGTKNIVNEEEKGKIVHEYRNIVIDGKPISARSLQIFHKLAQNWGGTAEELAYYGSFDATPLFLKVLHTYCELYGSNILNEEVIQKNNRSITVKAAALLATNWLTGHLQASRSGLLEYKRINPKGIRNQVWKDSEEFYVHENGLIANHNMPIASIELQALAYDALLASAYIFTKNSAEYLQVANTLRDKTIDLLWQPDRNYFALGLDYEHSGKMRIIHTTAANAAALLDSAFFNDLPNGNKHEYISAVVQKIMSYEFLTNAGIRSRSLAAAHVIKFWDYHGSFVSWPKETYDIAKGLRRQGFNKLAQQLENRLLNVVLKHRQYPEFVYVDGWGRILDSTPALHQHGNIISVDSSQNPERIQAWTVSAILAITTDRLNYALTFKRPASKDNWQNKLQQHILDNIPIVARHINPFTLQQQYRKYPYKLRS